MRQTTSRAFAGTPSTVPPVDCCGQVSDAVNLFRQCVRVLPHRLDRQISIRLVDADSSPGTDPMAVEEEHDFANLHPFLPGIGNPFPTLRSDTINGLQVGGGFFCFRPTLWHPNARSHYD